MIEVEPKNWHEMFTLVEKVVEAYGYELLELEMATLDPGWKYKMKISKALHKRRDYEI